MAPSTHSLITNEVVCIFGTNPLDGLAKARVHAAIDRALTLGDDVKIAIFGCHQPKMTYTEQSEAEILADYLTSCLRHLASKEPDHARRLRLLHLADTENQYLFFAPEINSTSQTCKVIVKDFIAQGDNVHLVITWFSTPRLYYLLYRQAKRAGLPWMKDRNRVYLVPSRCPNEFFAYLYREVRAWYKAIFDPYSEKMNLDRKH